MIDDCRYTVTFLVSMVIGRAYQYIMIYDIASIKT